MNGPPVVRQLQAEILDLEAVNHLDCCKKRLKAEILQAPFRADFRTCHLEYHYDYLETFSRH